MNEQNDETMELMEDCEEFILTMEEIENWYRGWKKETANLSNPHEIISSENAVKLIAYGTETTPFLMDRLEQDLDYTVVFLLEKIHPDALEVSLENSGDLVYVAGLWSTWWTNYEETHDIIHLPPGVVIDTGILQLGEENAPGLYISPEDAEAFSKSLEAICQVVDTVEHHAHVRGQQLDGSVIIARQNLRVFRDVIDIKICKKDPEERRLIHLPQKIIA